MFKTSYSNFLTFHSSPPVHPKTPTLTASPSDSTVAMGTRVTLTCATSSHGTTTYRFLLNNKEVYHGSSNKYTTPTSASGNSNSYTCTATISGAQSAPSTQHGISYSGKLLKNMFRSLWLNHTFVWYYLTNEVNAVHLSCMGRGNSLQLK